MITSNEQLRQAQADIQTIWRFLVAVARELCTLCPIVQRQ
jgi:hypothetical protein